MDQRVFGLLVSLRDQLTWAESKKIQFRGNCKEREDFYSGVAWALGGVIDTIESLYQEAKPRRGTKKGGKK